MPCYHPLQAFFSHYVDGTRHVKFSSAAARLFELGFTPLGKDNFQLPCGRCMGCRLERSRQWAMRCMHEASLWDDNCFITCTYDDDSLPEGGSLSLRDFQLFMKKLRREYGAGIRFFHCGEYGEKLSRPHDHAILFNHDFKDKKFWKTSADGDLFVSQSLSTLWGHGFCTVGAVSFESCAYVARYCTKKITGPDAEAYYAGKRPEYATMSRGRGIGYEWYQKFKKDAYPSDYLVMNGVKMKPPRYYDSLFEIDAPEVMEQIKVSRILKASDREADNSCRRLRDREKCKEAQFKRLVRPLEKIL